MIKATKDNIKEMIATTEKVQKDGIEKEENAKIAAEK